MLADIEAVLAIVVIDLVLSGDNAVVIGMAARRLSPENRRRAILLGGAGAVTLRVAFTALAAVLLGVPYLRLAGGIALLWIAWKLVRPAGDHGGVTSADNLGGAVRTIVLADVVMSLDNILAVGGAAHGDVRLLLFGLLLSIPILLLGAELVARALGRVPALLYAGVFVLVHTAVGMIIEGGPAAPLGEGWQTWAAAAAVTVALAAPVLRGDPGAGGGREVGGGDGMALALEQVVHRVEEVAVAIDRDDDQCPTHPVSFRDHSPGRTDGVLPGAAGPEHLSSSLQNGFGTRSGAQIRDAERSDLPLVRRFPG